jgi:hypothetical protein
MTNPIHKVAYDWHHLPATALHQQFPAMAEAIDKLIERQNERGEYVVDTELTALTQQINDELVVQLGSFRRFMDGFHILMQDADTKGLYDPANFCIPKKMFRKKGTIGWLIDNKLIAIFEGSTLQVKSLEFEMVDDAVPKVLRCASHCHPWHNLDPLRLFAPCLVALCIVCWPTFDPHPIAAALLRPRSCPTSGGRPRSFLSKSQHCASARTLGETQSKVICGAGTSQSFVPSAMRVPGGTIRSDDLTSSCLCPSARSTSRPRAISMSGATTSRCTWSCSCSSPL